MLLLYAPILNLLYMPYPQSKGAHRVNATIYV